MLRGSISEIAKEFRFGRGWVLSRGAGGDSSAERGTEVIGAGGGGKGTGVGGILEEFPAAI